jgi:antiviral helicase SLH1
LVVVPRKSVAYEILADLRGFNKRIGATVELGSAPHALKRGKGRVIRVVPAQQILQCFSGHSAKEQLSAIDMIILENLEQLDSAYELAVSLLRYATQTSKTRFVGFSHSLGDPSDLAAWLGVDPFSLFSFRPQDRDQALITTTQTFTIPQSASLFKAMAKPAHSAIQSAGPEEQAVVFVPSRGQCRPIAFDLITQCALDAVTDRGYLPAEVADGVMDVHLVQLQDRSLIDLVSRGIGIFHEGVHKSDRNLMLELYAEGLIRVLIVPRDACWSVPVRSAVVVVMGTQYFQFLGSNREGERQLREYDLTELVHMQSRAVRHSGIGHFYLFCQSEAKETALRFLNEGLPLESKLLETQELVEWCKSNCDVKQRQNVADVLSFTYLARRAASNPSYYDCSGDTLNEKLSRIVDRILDVPADNSH